MLVASPHPSRPLTAQEEELIQSENSASIFNTLSDIPSQIEDAELLLGEAMRLAGSLTDVAVETQRRKHLAYLIADQGQLLGTSAPTNLSQVCPCMRPPRMPKGEGLWGHPAFRCSATSTALPPPSSTSTHTQGLARLAG